MLSSGYAVSPSVLNGSPMDGSDTQAIYTDIERSIRRAEANDFSREHGIDLFFQTPHNRSRLRQGTIWEEYDPTSEGATSHYQPRVAYYLKPPPHPPAQWQSETNGKDRHHYGCLPVHTPNVHVNEVNEELLSPCPTLSSPTHRTPTPELEAPENYHTPEKTSSFQSTCFRNTTPPPEVSHLANKRSQPTKAVIPRREVNASSAKRAEDIDVQDDEIPYAQLIYKALMSVPSKTMILSEIYRYFRENIPRFAKTRTKGWQNSIRHNLSMNGAFRKVERPLAPDGTKQRGYFWVLSPEAQAEGVKSTTRFRKHCSPPRRKSADFDSALQDSNSRSVKGRFTKKATKFDKLESQPQPKERSPTRQSRPQPKEMPPTRQSQSQPKERFPTRQSTPSDEAPYTPPAPTQEYYHRYPITSPEHYSTGDTATCHIEIVELESELEAWRNGVQSFTDYHQPLPTPYPYPYSYPTEYQSDDSVNSSFDEVFDLIRASHNQEPERTSTDDFTVQPWPIANFDFYAFT